MDRAASYFRQLAQVDPAQRSQLLTLQSQLLSADDADLANSTEQVQRLELCSPFTGKLMDVDPDLQSGDWVGKGAALAMLVPTVPGALLPGAMSLCGRRTAG